MNAVSGVQAAAVARSRPDARGAAWTHGLAAAGAWAGVSVLTWVWPDADDLGRTGLRAAGAAVAAVLAGAALLARARVLPAALRHAARARLA